MYKIGNDKRRRTSYSTVPNIGRHSFGARDLNLPYVFLLLISQYKESIGCEFKCKIYVYDLEVGKRQEMAAVSCFPVCMHACI